MLGMMTEKEKVTQGVLKYRIREFMYMVPHGDYLLMKKRICENAHITERHFDRIAASEVGDSINPTEIILRTIAGELGVKVDDLFTRPVKTDGHTPTLDDMVPEGPDAWTEGDSV